MEDGCRSLHDRADQLFLVVVGHAGCDGRGAVDDVFDAFDSFVVGVICEDVLGGDEGDVGPRCSVS